MNVPEPSSESRKKFVDDVLTSGAFCRLVVAGPGTGKSHLFGEEISRHSDKSLLISFLRGYSGNNLKRKESQSALATVLVWDGLDYLQGRG